MLGVVGAFLNNPGTLTLLNTSVSLCELGGVLRGTQSDALDVSGATFLVGTLQLTFVNHFQDAVSAAASLTLLNSTALTGSFVNVPTTGLRLATTDGLGSFQVNFPSTALSLSNFVPVPEPSTWALLPLGFATVDLFAPPPPPLSEARAKWASLLILFRCRHCEVFAYLLRR